MALFDLVGTCSDGPAQLCAGISGLTILGSGPALRLVTATGRQGGLALRDPAPRWR